MQTVVGRFGSGAATQVSAMISAAASAGVGRGRESARDRALTGRPLERCLSQDPVVLDGIDSGALR